MADPLKAQPGAEDNARIEHLLVTGLDHYFAGDFEQAINLWTRVLFLDRTHDRARAYIDRARSAQAERQRVSEALVHQGLEAFDRGEVARARELLSDALDQGASHDVALGVLGRIDRLDVGHTAAKPFTAPRRRPFSRPAPGVQADPGHRGTLALWLSTAAAVVLISVTAFVLVSPGGIGDWFPAQATTAGAPVQLSPTPGPLPLPAPTETYVAQARSMFASGKLRDALRALDRVPAGDSLRDQADRLRGDIQRELLAVAAAEVSSSAGAPPASPPQE